VKKTAAAPAKKAGTAADKKKPAAADKKGAKKPTVAKKVGDGKSAGKKTAKKPVSKKPAKPTKASGDAAKLQKGTAKAKAEAVVKAKKAKTRVSEINNSSDIKWPSNDEHLRGNLFEFKT
jgi:hypothetical protein